VVFLEFVIDPGCTLVYEAEKGSDDAMRRPPRDPGEPLFNLHMLGVSLLLGAGMLAGVLAVYALALAAGRSDGETRAAAFAAVVFANLALLFVTRSRDRTALQILREPNAALWWIVGGALAALTASIYFTPAAEIFRFAPLAAGDLALAAAAGIASVAWYEVRKVTRRR
jgi:Ca2+-transporting ATPase